jgi:acylphosphatase
MSGVIVRRCHVAGRVQGVFYRASARQRAIELGITGYARNLPDGRVEVLACGESTAVAQFCDWLRQGPPSARVSDVASMDLEVTVIGTLPADFSTG